MKLSEAVKSNSYLKSNTAEAVREVRDKSRAMAITQSGEV